MPSMTRLIGLVVSKILLSVIFFFVVTPMGLIRRMLGKDSLQLNEWKKGDGSVMKERNHTFQAQDLEKPF